MERALSVGWTKGPLSPAGWRISSVTVTPSQKIWLTRKYWAQSAKQDACVRMSDRGEELAKLTQQLFFYCIVTHTPCVIWWSGLLPSVSEGIQDKNQNLEFIVRSGHENQAHPSVRRGRDPIPVQFLLISTHPQCLLHRHSLLTRARSSLRC